ncbi:MAG: zf-HC2 domain-containing protein [Vicinamibacteria bacterium]
MRMTCREVYGFLDDFLAGVLDPATLESFEAHLGRCSSCRTYMTTYRTTVAVARASELKDAPSEDVVPVEMVKAILDARVEAFKKQSSE